MAVCSSKSGRKTGTRRIALHEERGILVPSSVRIASAKTISENTVRRLGLATLRVGLKKNGDSTTAALAHLTVQPQTVTAEQAVDDGPPQNVTLTIGLKRLHVLLLLDGAAFDLSPSYSVEVDSESFKQEEHSQSGRSMAGKIDGDLGISTPLGTPLVTAKVDASANMQASKEQTRTETASHKIFLVETDTLPMGADPDQARRWRVGIDGVGGDPERGKPYLLGDTYLNRADHPLATIEVQDRVNRVAVDMALSIQSDDFYVSCTVPDGSVNQDDMKVKALLVQMVFGHAIKNISPEKFESILKNEEILIDVRHKEMDR